MASRQVFSDQRLNKGLFKKLFKEIAIYGLGDLLLKAISLITFPIYSRLLTVEDYGVMNSITTTVGLISAVIILGGDSAYARYFFETKDDEEKKVVTSTVFIALSAWSLLIAAICLPLSKWASVSTLSSSDYTNLYLISFAAIPVTLINSICSQALRNRFKSGLFSALNITMVVMTVIITLFLVIKLQMGVAGIFLGSLIAGIAILPVRIWFIRDLLGLRFSGELLWKMLAYGLPLVPTSLAYWIFAVSDRIVLTKLSTLEQVGLYSVANQVSMIGAFVNAAIGQAWSPYATKLYSENKEQAAIFFGRFLTFILIGFGILSVGISVFAKELLLFLSTPEFSRASQAVPPLALGLIAYASTQVTALPISLTKKTKFFAIFSWLSAIFNLILNVLFVSDYGMMASSWATAFSYIFLTVGYLVVSQKLFPIHYEIKPTVKIIFICGLFTIGTFWIPNSENIFITIAIKTAYLLIFMILLIIGSDVKLENIKNIFSKKLQSA